MMTDAVRFYQTLCEEAVRDYPIRDAFQQFFPAYASSHSVSSEQSKAARCISECKTGSLGYNISYCESCAYYHSIFTVPFELNDLIYENQKLLYNLMLTCTSETLLTLCRDKKYLGAAPGIIMVLHTWGQQLNFHPHIVALLVVDLQNQVSLRNPATKVFFFRKVQLERCSVVNLWRNSNLIMKKICSLYMGNVHICAIDTAGRNS